MPNEKKKKLTGDRDAGEKRVYKVLGCFNK